jgi:hypothetical protein
MGSLDAIVNASIMPPSTTIDNKEEEDDEIL